MTTLRKRSMTGLKARLASRHARSSCGSGMPADPLRIGSTTTEKPSAYVETLAAKAATSARAWTSSMCGAWSVRNNWFRRLWKNFSGFASMRCASSKPSRNAAGDSTSTRVARSRFDRCSVNFFSSCKNDSARRTLPGTASCSKSSGSAAAAAAGSSAAFASAGGARPRPRTSLSYSSRTRAWSDSRSCDTLRSRRVTQRCAASSLLRWSSTESASMQMLSMLCASSKTTTDSFSSSRVTMPATFGSSMYW
mmetsp:Transcript_1344/g.4009  ORF Transcript_1344/g.4009 Transcript_1344/m.4009 type:complete len:251 (+) Transcript_1344:1266-2018(+)